MAPFMNHEREAVVPYLDYSTGKVHVKTAVNTSEALSHLANLALNSLVTGVVCG